MEQTWVIQCWECKDTMKKNHQKNRQESPKLKSHPIERVRKKVSLKGKSKRTASSKKNLKSTSETRFQSLKPKSKNLSDWLPNQHQQKKPTTTKNSLTKRAKRRMRLNNNSQNRSKTCVVSWTSMILRATQISKRLILNPSRTLMILRDSCYRMIQRFFQHSPVRLMQTPPSSMRHPKKIVEQQRQIEIRRLKKSRTRSRNSSSTSSQNKSTASSKQLKGITPLLSTLKKPSRTSFTPLNKKSKRVGTSI